ncbi:MAG TPA: diaminopimelate decarboxylase, partial [Nitrospirota bacterium]|nr:diaminopimelate decarboxylase [Nitrospirota bacterium]
DELQALNEVAGEMGVKARIALRVNPDIDPKTHSYISTGLRENKFGIPIEHALEHYLTARSLPNVEIVGVHHHIGSQITEVGPFVEALDKVAALVTELRAAGMNIAYIDIGGGLGITYKDETPPQPQELASAIQGRIPRDCTLVLEPGRAIVGNAGVLVTSALYRKDSGAKHFLIVDAGMNDLIRPSLYEAYHEIKPVRESPAAERAVFDVVGPICESGDFLAKDRELPVVRKGELLAVMSAGAYGFSMASNYNSRPRAAEVMVRGRDYFIVRERETYNDLVKGEKVPGWLKG